MEWNTSEEKLGEPGRTRTSNPLIASRSAKYSMFQAVSWFRECQKWAVLGVVVTKDVMKFLAPSLSSDFVPRFSRFEVGIVIVKSSKHLIEVRNVFRPDLRRLASQRRQEFYPVSNHL